MIYQAKYAYSRQKCYLLFVNNIKLYLTIDVNCKGTIASVVIIISSIAGYNGAIAIKYVATLVVTNWCERISRVVCDSRC